MIFCKKGCGAEFANKAQHDLHYESCMHEKCITKPIECYVTIEFNILGSRKEEITGYHATEKEAIAGAGCGEFRIVRLVQTTPK